MTGSINRKVLIDSKRAESLLFPIVVLLRMSGLTKEAIENCLSLVYTRASRSIKGRKIKRIGHSTRYTDVVSRWIHDKRFLDAKGQPRTLKLHGKTGFVALVRGV